MFPRLKGQTLLRLITIGSAIKGLAKSAEDRTERLDIVPAQLRVVVTIHPKYARPVCEQRVTQALAPARLIEGGLPTEGAVTHVLVSRYAEDPPLYRQSAIYVRSGLDLHRLTLAGWVGKASFPLKPVADRLASHLKRSLKLLMDETRAPVLDPGRGRTKTGWLWASAGDDVSDAGEARRFQLDGGLKCQGSSSSMRLFGWPAAIFSSVSLSQA